MKYVTTAAVLYALVFGSAAPVRADARVIEPLPQELEIRLALSAAPAHLQAEATVYVLDPTVGYTLAKQGSNGFSCVVARTVPGKPEYRNDLVIPVCYDQEGTDTILPTRFDIEALRAKGRSKKALQEELAQNFASGKYQAPKRNGYAPMLSSIFRTYPGPDATQPTLLNYPHLMFYAPYVKNADIAGRLFDQTYPWVLDGALEGGSPHTLIIQAVGEAERAKLNQEHKPLMEDFCAFKQEWCQ